jgi:hypothetical protein
MQPARQRLVLPPVPLVIDHKSPVFPESSARVPSGPVPRPLLLWPIPRLLFEISQVLPHLVVLVKFCNFARAELNLGSREWVQGEGGG